MTVAGVRADGSLGVARYAGRLAGALGDLGVDYRPGPRPRPGERVHFHLANSSRGSAWQSLLADVPFALTVHDVVPRAAALRPLHRAWMVPRVVARAGRVIVHSRAAADALVRQRALAPGRLVVLPHPAPAPHDPDRAAARRALGWPDGPPVAVLPGVIKGAKMVAQALEAAAPSIRAGEWRLVLAGPVADAGLARLARDAGALVLPHPDDRTYERAIVAADLVLVLRAASVGETNGPLLDAIGAGRAVLATSTGSIPEVAGDAAELCAPTVAGIAAGLRRMSDDGARVGRARAAAERAAALTWQASARAHRDLFAELWR